MCIVESLSKGHFGTSHFVLYREVVLIPSNLTLKNMVNGPTKTWSMDQPDLELVVSAQIQLVHDLDG